MKLTRVLAIASFAGVIASVAQESVTLGVFGYTQVDIPPYGGVNLVGFNFTSSDALTLRDIFGDDNLTKSTRSRNADKIYIWNGSGYDSYYQSSVDNIFYDVLTKEPASVEIEAGASMFLQSPSAATETNRITLSGAVLLADSTDVIYSNSLMTIANPYAASIDFNDVNMNWANATGNSRSRNADKLYIWNPSTFQYDTFYLDADKVWQVLASSIAEPVLDLGGGAFYMAQNSFTNSIIKPFDEK